MLSNEQLTTLMAVARKVAASSVAPKGYSEETVFAVMLAGAELGFEPMQSLSAFHVIQGRLGLRADFVVGLCTRSPVCKHFTLIESTDKVATYETLREGHAAPTRMSFTIEQAQRAKLMANALWGTHPDAMLRARCASRLARAVFPDLAAGIYTPDEAEEIAANDNPRALREPVTHVRELPAQTPAAEPPAEHPALAAYRTRLAACTASAELIAVRLALGPTLRPLSEAERAVGKSLTTEHALAHFGNIEDFDSALKEAQALSQEAAHWSVMAEVLAGLAAAKTLDATKAVVAAHAKASMALPEAMRGRLTSALRATQKALSAPAPTDVAAALEAELLAAGDIAALDDVAAKIETAAQTRAVSADQAKALIDRYNNRVAEYEREPVQDAAE
jgi:hypothetical protein